MRQRRVGKRRALRFAQRLYDMYEASEWRDPVQVYMHEEYSGDGDKMVNLYRRFNEAGVRTWQAEVYSLRHVASIDATFALFCEHYDPTDGFTVTRKTVYFVGGHGWTNLMSTP